MIRQRSALIAIGWLQRWSRQKRRMAEGDFLQVGPHHDFTGLQAPREYLSQRPVPTLDQGQEPFARVQDQFG
jgi:hypothetical protein